MRYNFFAVHFCKSQPTNFVEYFASRLKEAVTGPGTDDQTLVRIILSHCESDMVEIEEQFKKSYDRILSEKIDVSTSFKYTYSALNF